METKKLLIGCLFAAMLPAVTPDELPASPSVPAPQR